MAEYKVRVTRQAREQLREVRRYIDVSLMAPGAALNTVRAIRAEMESLSDKPYRYKPVDEEPWHSEGVRKTRVRNYYVYYWIDEEEKRVQITAVIYVRRDQEKALQYMQME